MILPDFIEGVGNEVLICALSLGGILLVVGMRLYNRGIRIIPSTSHTQPRSTNSNSDSTEAADSTAPNENAEVYHTGVLDTEYMESLRDVNHHPDTIGNSDQESALSMKSREDGERELQEARNSGNIVLRLQYLNDRVRYVHAPPDMPVALFKRKFFVEELEQSKSVRLIFQGRELKLANPNNPSQHRLCDYGVSDNSTIHCLISDAPPQSTSTQEQAGSTATFLGPSIFRANFTGSPDDIDFGSQALIPLLTFLLISAWLFRLAHSEYFSLLSTIALVCLSALFLGAVYSSISSGNRASTATEGSSAAAGDAIRTS
ncbi:hypothetical protein Aperf_G00000078571 [Anoplocephala perfoliata]